MAKDSALATRVQVYVNDARVIKALNREARLAKVPLSQAAGRAIARGLTFSLPADPDDRLLHLDRALRQHMRATARDMQIIQELIVELARAFFLRLPDVEEDNDPLLQASIEARIERLLDATAARLIAGGSCAQEAPLAQTPGEAGRD